MKIVGIPVMEERGLLSRVSRVFAASPMLLLVEAETLAFLAIPNSPQRQEERGCSPCEALGDVSVDAVVVGEIEASALGQIARRHVPVYGGARGTVADALAALMCGRLECITTPWRPRTARRTGAEGESP